MKARLADSTPWLREGEEKRHAVREMFARIAPNYDLANSLMSVRLHRRWRGIAVKMLQLRPGDHALDVCCGTGDFLIPLRGAVGSAGKVIGLDFCQPMLDLAAKKPGHDAPLINGDACDLPFSPSEFDAVTVGWGIRNVPDIDRAHQEIARVLKPGGRFVSLDMAMPRNPLVRWGAQTISRFALPLCGSILGQKTAYTYLHESTERFKSREELAESMKNAGMTDVRWKDLFGGSICIHFGIKE